jgi:hypothetical protein
LSQVGLVTEGKWADFYIGIGFNTPIQTLLMKILIVEDEELAVKKLQKTLLAIGEDIDIVGTT